jgi:hypothetical protein
MKQEEFNKDTRLEVIVKYLESTMTDRHPRGFVSVEHIHEKIGEFKMLDKLKEWTRQ